MITMPGLECTLFPIQAVTVITRWLSRKACIEYRFEHFTKGCVEGNPGPTR